MLQLSGGAPVTWTSGPPTKPGLYVIEWMNLRGLAVYLVFRRGMDERLYAFDVRYAHPRETLRELREWSISRHIELPQPMPMDDVNTPSTYEAAGDDGFNLNVGEWGKVAAEHDRALRMLREEFGWRGVQDEAPYQEVK